MFRTVTVYPQVAAKELGIDIHLRRSSTWFRGWQATLAGTSWLGSSLRIADRPRSGPLWTWAPMERSPLATTNGSSAALPPPGPPLRRWHKARHAGHQGRHREGNHSEGRLCTDIGTQAKHMRLRPNPIVFTSSRETTSSTARQGSTSRRIREELSRKTMRSCSCWLAQARLRREPSL